MNKDGNATADSDKICGDLQNQTLNFSHSIYEVAVAEW